MMLEVAGGTNDKQIWEMRKSTLGKIALLLV